jgi:hypothetical protein
MSEETITFNLDIIVQGTIDNIRKIEMIAYRSMALLKRFGLPENINQAVMYIQRFIGIIRLLHSSLNLLMSTTPFGILQVVQAGLGVATVAMSVGDIMMENQGTP